MSTRIVVEIPSSKRWIEMKGYLRQWKLTLPPKFIIKDTNKREIRDTIERARRIVKTHECGEEFGQMLELIAVDVEARNTARTAGRAKSRRKGRLQPC